MARSSGVLATLAVLLGMAVPQPTDSACCCFSAREPMPASGVASDAPRQSAMKTRGADATPLATRGADATPLAERYPIRDPRIANSLPRNAHGQHRIRRHEHFVHALGLLRLAGDRVVQLPGLCLCEHSDVGGGGPAGLLATVHDSGYAASQGV